MSAPRFPAPLRRRLHRALAAAGTTAVLALGSCGGGQRPDLKVTTFSPVRLADGDGPIEVHFDKPVIDDAQVGAGVTTGIAIEPAVPWRGHWQDRQTLILEPLEPLRASTRYRVVLTDALARRTGGFHFEFVQQPLTVDGLVGDSDPAALPIDRPFHLGFAQKVRARDVAAHCVLRGPTGAIALAVETPDEVATSIAVRAPGALPADADFTLACSGLSAAGADAPMLEPWELAVHTRSNLFVRSLTPIGDDIAADEVTIEIALSTPVALDEIRKAVTSTPAIPGLDRGWLDGGGTRYRVTADLETDTQYTVTVAGLRDTFGQRLADDAVAVFTTGDASPRLSLERGIYALEASAAGYPVWSRNVHAYDVECGAIPTARLVQALTTDMNYDPWGGSDDTQPIGWKALGVTPVKRTVQVAGAKNKWHLDTVDLGATCGGQAGARGVFLADLRSAEIKIDPDQPWRTPTTNRVLANVTDLGVLIKSGPSSGLVWVTSLATGAPVAAAKVTLYTPQGKAVFTGATDASGLLRTPGSAQLLAQPAADRTAVEDEEESWEEWDSYRAQRLLAVVEKGGDTAIVDGNWANGIQIWNFGVDEDRAGGATKLRGFVQSDRGLYRPGEEVHLKGLVREVAAGHTPRVPRLAGPTPITVDVTDSRGATLTTRQVAMSAFGGWSFDLPIGAEAALGDYYVRATVAGQVFRERFTVEEFRPAAFEIKVTSGTQRIRPGERLAATIDAQYLFGAPVAGARVEWSVLRREHALRFPGFDQYTFESNPRWWWYGDDGDYGELVSDGEGTTDARGRFALGLHDPSPDLTGPRDYLVRAAITDLADQTLARTAVITAHATDVYVGLHTQEWVQAVGMPFAVNAVAMSPAGERVAHGATLRFVREVADCSYDQYGFRSYARCTNHDEVMLERAVAIPATGAATERIYPTAPGYYRIELATTDSHGTKVLAASSVYVIGKGEAFWSGDESARMTLVANRSSYQVGDPVRLAAQTGLKRPTALITIERDGVVTAEVRRLASASEGLELTADPSWAPNVFASVTMVSGRQGPGDRDRPQMKMGVVELKVSAEARRLAVAIATDRTSYQPGEPVTGTITVTHDGRPVAAEVALSVADEGVLALIDYRTPDPMKTFYAAFGLGVDAGTNWNRIARLADPTSGDPDEGGDMAGPDDGQRIRSKFVSSAYWAPALVTDARGQARFEFAAPDNLTAFRLMAAAADAGDRFGAGEGRITVTKPVLAQTVLPRFFTVGDTASVGVIVHNRTDAGGTALVTARATGVTLASATGKVEVAAGGSARIRFAARVDDAASAQLEFAVALGGHRDVVRVDLPVTRPRVRTPRLVAVGQLGGAPVEVAAATPASAIAGESELTITIDRTGLGDLEPSLRYLVEYPYGCLEQTMSSFIPLAKAKDLAASMNLAALQGTRADQFLAAGVAKVVRHQQGDGHFSLWPQSQTYPHLTALALFGLGEARKAGVAVPEDAMVRGREALARWMAERDSWTRRGDTAVIAMSAYLLAASGHPDHGVLARLYDQRANLPPWGLAFLARALHAAPAPRGKAQLAEVVKLLRARVTVDGERALVADGHDDVDSELMSSDVRSSAMVLAALLEVAPRDPLIDRLVRGLDGARTPDGRWVNTQDNVWTLIALADYARRAGTGQAEVRVTSGSRTLQAATLTGGQVVVVRTRPSELTGGALAITGTGPVHYRVRAVDVTVDAGAPISRGFTIQRAYLVDGKETTTFQAGQLVTVRLTVDAPAGARWIALVDPIPAGFEAVNPRLASAGGSGAGHDWVWSHQELRDDAARWFADDLYPGKHEMTYQVRATLDGSFAAGPAMIEAMYDPSMMARTAAARVTIAP